MSRPLNALRPVMVPLCLALLTSACGGHEEKATNSVAMKDLEVVDGTATDAMTDLDGVRVEGTAMAPASSHAATQPAEPQATNESAAEKPDTEVVSDQ